MTTDFDGVTIPQGNAPDIGAYEYINVGRIVTYNATPSQMRAIVETPHPSQHGRVGKDWKYKTPGWVKK